MPGDPIHQQLADLALAADLRAWRRAHPDATLTEIERALDARLAPARADLLAQLAMDVPEDAERCSECGGRLTREGTRTRTLRTQGDAPLDLTRAYLRCPVCEAGLFPPR